jgi:glc operon protein GlcG
MPIRRHSPEEIAVMVCLLNCRIIVWCLGLLFVAAVPLRAEDGEPASRGESDYVMPGPGELTLAGAQRVIQAARQRAQQMDLRVNIAVVDDGGHLLAFARMDGARPGSVYTSITKATSAALMRGRTGPLPQPGTVPTDTHLSLAVEHAAMQSGGKFTTLYGGIPIVLDGKVIGAVGVGGATGAQDAEIAAAGVEALGQRFGSGLAQ